MTSFGIDIAADGTAIVTFDLPQEKVNKLTTAVMEELNALLDKLAADTSIKSLVFRSAKEGSFIAGADIAEIRNIADPETGRLLAARGQAVFAKIASLPFTTVAAIHGPCLGGGLELALACDRRIISNDPKTSLGLPEVLLGIMPGFGGTQRLPRLVGLTNALDMILTGKSVHSKKALKIGLADEIADREHLLTRAVILARDSVGKHRPTAIRAKRSLLVSLAESNALTRGLIFQAVKRKILRETRGNYPAPLMALESVRFGSAHPGLAGYTHEAAMLGELAASSTAKNLISVFYLREALKKDLRPSEERISLAGVLGAGVMGGGIAQLFAEKGVPVRMKDITAKAVGAGLHEAADVFGKRQRKGILTAIQSRDGMDRITGTMDYSGFSSCDLAVEAVVENMNVKKSVLAEFEKTAKPGAIYASNTSSLSITELAAASQHPDRVIGMHFFNPVEKMQLVEVVRGRSTSDATAAAVATLSRKLGKLPVVVNDGPGFLVNRILMPYLNEAAVLLVEGNRIEEIDEALMNFGMPMGAFILLDEIGIDVSHKVADILHQGLGDRAQPSPLLDALFQSGYLGRKNSKGFYHYKGKKRGRPDASIYTRLGKPGAQWKSSREDIIARCIMLMIKEAILCLEENITNQPGQLDAALVFGIGFPPFRGGLLRYADSLGAQTVFTNLERFAKQCGDRFAPPARLAEMAKTGMKFYAEEKQRSL